MLIHRIVKTSIIALLVLFLGIPSSFLMAAILDLEAQIEVKINQIFLQKYAPNFSFIEPCMKALGMQNRRIPNYAITASSMWDRNHAPYFGRLHFTARGRYQGAWCARQNNRFQWFQVDFRRPTKVTKVVTQGRQNANQWVTQYRLAYSQDGLIWAYYKYRDRIKVRRIMLN